MHKYYFLILLTLTCFLNCRKPVIEVNKDFIGEWYAGGTNSMYYKAFLSINERSYGILRYQWGESSQVVSGVARIKDKTFKIGSRKFSINLMPSIINYLPNQDSIPVPYGSPQDTAGKPVFATWEMELEQNSILHVKVAWKFYK